MWWITIGAAFLLGYLSRRKPVQTPLDRLKNALLSFALAITCKNDVSESALYANYDGTKLPTMSGADLTNACFTYILDVNEFRKDPWYSQVMEAKIHAINRYIDKNLDTDEKVTILFNKFIARQNGSVEKSS